VLARADAYEATLGRGDELERDPHLTPELRALTVNLICDGLAHLPGTVRK
jgi:hypothetical protein